MLPPASRPTSIAIPRSYNMSPTPNSPAHKLPSLTYRTSSQDSTADGIRKRVCKACDRCRLKKSKCDGSNPCLRCKADNAICVFGERKKSHDKVYPKGYVEMLEQQQSQLVAGLQDMYRRLQAARAWEGKKLSESNGHPLTHDILAALNLLEVKHDGSGATETFEEDVQKLQSKLIAEGRGYVQRRGSVSSESEHSQHGHSRTASAIPPRTDNHFRESFNFGSNTSSPLVQSPIPHFRQPRLSTQPSPVTSTFQHNDPQLYAPEWAQALNEANQQATQSRFAFSQLQTESTADDINLINDDQWTTSFNNFDASYPHYANLQAMGDVANLDGMDVDFSKFVNPSAAMEVYI